MSEISEYSRALGSLEASVRHLTETWAKQEQNATSGRRALHEKFDRLDDKVNTLSDTVSKMDAKLADVSPAIDEFKNQREQAKGAAQEQRRLMRLGKGLWGAMMAAAGLTATIIGWFLHGWLSPPAH